MALLTVNVSGTKHVVDSNNKGSAKAWGRAKLDVTVTEATAEEVTTFLTEGGVIEKVEAAPKAAAEPTGEPAAQ